MSPQQALLMLARGAKLTKPDAKYFYVFLHDGQILDNWGQIFDGDFNGFQLYK